MTIPRWLLPIFAIVTAIAVGIAASLIALQFRPDELPATQTVPVLEPVSIGDAAPISDDDPETLEVSGASGEIEIVTPGTLEEGELSADTEARIDALDASDGLDEATAREVVASTAETADPPVGDPCSPPDASTPEGCPDGLRSAIFALTEPGPLLLFVRADPPAVPTARGGLVTCPAAPDGSLSFGVATSVPAQVTVRYWPVGDPAAEQSVSIDNLPEEVAAWDAVIVEDGGFREGYGLFQHCTTLPDLAPSTAYESSIIAVDIFDRVEGRTYMFDSRGTPERPPMVVHPLGPSLLYVSVPSTTTGPLPEVRAWVVDPGDPADCSTWDEERAIDRVVPQSELEVSSGYLADRNYAAAFTRRVSSVFSAPEGSVIVVCARWYNIEAPSWRTDLPTEQLSVVVTSPDTLVPIVRLTGLALAARVEDRSFEIFASSTFGFPCEQRLLVPDFDEPPAMLPVDNLLCSPGSESARWESGSIGNIVVTSVIRGRDGLVTTSRVLPLGRYNCTGICALPPTRTYELLLPTITVGAGMCGSSVFGGSCTPPTREVALGTATVTVTWEQGATTGASEWGIGESSLVIPEDDVPDYPQLNTRNTVDGSVDENGVSGLLSVPIEVDRQSSYRVTVEGDCFIDGPPEPAIGEVRPFRDNTVYPSIRGLCVGEDYQVTVELTDVAGNRSTYGPSRPPPFLWSGGYASLPLAYLSIEGTIEIDNLGRGGRIGWGMYGGRVRLGNDFLSTSFPVDACFTPAELNTSGTFAGNAALTPVVHVRAEAVVYVPTLHGGRNPDATCEWPSQKLYFGIIEIDVPYTDLLRGVTVTQVMVRPEFPEERHFEITVTLQATRL